MTVSGLGQMRTPRSPVTPLHNRAAQVEKPTPRNEFDALTAADRELIFQATGQRLGPGFDPAQEAPTGFAAALAHKRATGRLQPGQPVTAVYLKDLNRRYQRVPGANPIAPYLDKAVAYLSASGARRIDVSA